MAIRVAEIVGDDWNPGRLGGVDIGLRIADHHRPLRIAAGEHDRFEEVARVGLSEGKRILPGDRGEAPAEAERREQRPGRRFVLVGAHRQEIAGPVESLQGIDDAGVGA